MKISNLYFESFDDFEQDKLSQYLYSKEIEYFENLLKSKLLFRIDLLLQKYQVVKIKVEISKSEINTNNLEIVLFKQYQMTGDVHHCIRNGSIHYINLIIGTYESTIIDVITKLKELK